MTTLGLPKISPRLSLRPLTSFPKPLCSHRSRHFPGDVIAGAILGNSVGRMALARDGRDGWLSPGRFQPIFDPSRRAIGVGYNYSW
jgi:hypothetical protein